MRWVSGKDVGYTFVRERAVIIDGLTGRVRGGVVRRTDFGGPRQPWCAWSWAEGDCSLHWRRCDAKRAVEMYLDGGIVVPLTKREQRAAKWQRYSGKVPFLGVPL